MELSLTEAAKMAGKGKSTVHRAIKAGRLSARKTDDGAYLIDASELVRVFPLNVPEQRDEAPRDTSEQPTEDRGMGDEALRMKLEMLETMLRKEQDERAKERETLQATIEDLRRWRDRAEERVYALTYQASQVQETAKPKGVLQRLLGWG